MKKSELKKQANEILKMAEKYGVQQNYLFLTTFNRYQMQLKILDELEKKIKKDGPLVNKEYVKGRENVYAHPAISEYNRTTDSANKTVGCLMNIVLKLKEADGGSEKQVDPLLEALGLV